LARLSAADVAGIPAVLNAIGYESVVVVLLLVLGVGLAVQVWLKRITTASRTHRFRTAG
jgi:hypothetical protein